MVDDERTQQQEPAPSTVLRPRLSWKEGGQVHALVLEEPVTVGSAPSCQIATAERTTSRLHAELALRAEGLWVSDLGSRNGTFVNGIQVERARVPAGATISFGRFEVRVEPEPEPRSAMTLWSQTHYHGLLGQAPVMRALFALLDRVAKSHANVLVRAETGSGKELVAQAIHRASPRAEGPLVVVDCAALPDNLLESELFGHARGAFTGAQQAREGAFEAAASGTLFLDEIGELPLDLQPKLLRVLESRTVRRLGETAHRPVDVRVVAASHRDLRQMVNQGTFREDLYFRLAVLPVSVPPLRERLEDLPLLLEKFLGQPARVVLGAGQLAELHRWPWPGNVRELRNFAERVQTLGAAVALAMQRGDDALVHLASGAGDEELPVADAPRAPNEHEPATCDEVTSSGPGGEADAALGLPPPDPDRETLHEFRERWAGAAERTYLRVLLERYGQNLADAAKRAGIARGHIYRLMRRYPS